ncbi:MAG: hypothetical protein H6735_31275 [Alphaproteobacteria bacterium]|nr:hypothetical protein [Alphaproteobacteria bacterium]
MLVYLATVAFAADELAGVKVGSALPAVLGWTPTSEGSLVRPAEWHGLEGKVEVRTCDNGRVRVVTFTTDGDVFDPVARALTGEGWSAAPGTPLFAGGRALVLTRDGVTRTLSANSAMTTLQSRDDRVCEAR